jgi:RND superfamily putative drug exporter
VASPEAAKPGASEPHLVLHPTALPYTFFYRGISIASGFTDIGSSTSALALMLGLAAPTGSSEPPPKLVRIDYALFIVSRHRQELLAGRAPDEAAGRAVGTAGSAVVFAGATVIIALAALLVVGIPFLAAMGLAAAFTVLAAVVIALTLVPALLGFIGARALNHRDLAAHEIKPGEAVAAQDTSRRSARAAKEPMGQRWAQFVVRRRIPVLLTVVLGMAPVALPALDLRLGMPSDATAFADTTQRRAYDALAAGFGPGFNGPLIIAVDLAGVTDRAVAAKAVQSDLAGLGDTAAVTAAMMNPVGGHHDVPQADHAYDMSDVEKARENYALIASWIKQATQPSTP